MSSHRSHRSSINNTGNNNGSSGNMGRQSYGDEEESTRPVRPSVFDRLGSRLVDSPKPPLPPLPPQSSSNHRKYLSPSPQPYHHSHLTSSNHQLPLSSSSHRRLTATSSPHSHPSLPPPLSSHRHSPYRHQQHSHSHQQHLQQHPVQDRRSLYDIHHSSTSRRRAEEMSSGQFNRSLDRVSKDEDHTSTALMRSSVNGGGGRHRHSTVGSAGRRSINSSPHSSVRSRLGQSSSTVIHSNGSSKEPTPGHHHHHHSQHQQHYRPMDVSKERDVKDVHFKRYGKCSFNQSIHILN